MLYFIGLAVGISIGKKVTSRVLEVVMTNLGFMLADILTKEQIIRLKEKIKNEKNGNRI